MRYSLKVLLVLALLSCGGAAALESRDIRIATGTGEVVLDAEFAVTEEERARGLMGREDFGPGDAMLFVFPEERWLSFWMKGTPVSLDIVFFDGEGRWINTASGTVPYSLEHHRSLGMGRFVLELAAGEAGRLGIGPGSRLAVPVPR